MKLKELLESFYKSEEDFVFIRRPNWDKGYLYRIDKDGDILDFDYLGTCFEREEFDEDEINATDWVEVKI